MDLPSAFSLRSATTTGLRVLRTIPWGWRFLIPGVASLSIALAGNPTFYDITPFLKRAVLVHFDTEAHRQYDLLFSTNVLSAPPGTWTKIYAVDALPFVDHFIAYHELTNGPVGFYRLVATP